MARLEMLKAHQAAWKSLQWRIDFEPVKFCDLAWDLIGGVLASGSNEEIQLVQLPSALRGIPRKDWTIKTPIEAEDFTHDPSQDLLVTIGCLVTGYVLHLSTRTRRLKLK